jgi:Gti1/Pac2 family transcription factor
MNMSARRPSEATSDVQHFIGYVETTTDALRLIMAARQGIIPRITRRLNDSERRSMIRSGAVFVFCVEESGIKRWTEGLSWSPSRIVGNFLVCHCIPLQSWLRLTKVTVA